METQRLEGMKARLEVLRGRVRLLTCNNNAQSPRCCSYCREPGHYRPTCEQLKQDTEHLKKLCDELQNELDRVRAERDQAEEAKQWWIDKAFELQDQLDELRKTLNTAVVHSHPTRGR